MEQIGHLSFGAAYMEYTKSLKKHVESKSANMDIGKILQDKHNFFTHQFCMDYFPNANNG